MSPEALWFFVGVAVGGLIVTLAVLAGTRQGTAGRLPPVSNMGGRRTPMPPGVKPPRTERHGARPAPTPRPTPPGGYPTLGGWSYGPGMPVHEYPKPSERHITDLIDQATTRPRSTGGPF